MKKFFSLLSVMAVAACQSPQQHYAYIPPPPPPPPPSHPAALHPYNGGLREPVVQQTLQPPQSPTRPELHARSRPAAIDFGDSAGPLAAKNVGAYMDGLERDLRHYLRGIPVARPGDVIVLNLKSDDIFGKDDARDGRDLLRNLSSALRHYDRTQVQVNGYTDTRTAPDQANKITQKRADAVAAELYANGVAANRLTAKGYGSAHLRIATGEGKAEARNRRIEIRVVPKPES